MHIIVHTTQPLLSVYIVYFSTATRLREMKDSHKGKDGGMKGEGGGRRM